MTPTEKEVNAEMLFSLVDDRQEENNRVQDSTHIAWVTTRQAIQIKVPN